MKFKLQGGKDHGQAFAAALGMPNQPRWVTPFQDPAVHFLDGAELLVSADLFGGFAVPGFENNEMGQDVEQAARLQ